MNPILKRVEEIEHKHCCDTCDDDTLWLTDELRGLLASHQQLVEALAGLIFECENYSHSPRQQIDEMTKVARQALAAAKGEGK
jgi:hypothetical protein